MKLLKTIVWISLSAMIAIFGGGVANSISQGVSVWDLPNLSDTLSSLGSPVTQAQSVASSTKEVAPAYLYRIQIPAIAVDARVESLGIAQSGHMAVPSGMKRVGWYRYGATPGAPGSVVMDGHVDNALGLPGVFAHLDKLRPGDEIYIQDMQGHTWVYAVSATAQFPYADAPVAEIFAGAYTTSRLHLITCSGTWQHSKKSYTNRLVVYADEVRE